MQIMMKSCSGVYMVPLESRLLANRKVYIQGEIDDEMACSFEQQIQFLLSEDPEKAIDIFINSPGGNVAAGLHMYDIIKGIKTEATMWCRGTTASMGAILLAGGQKGRRLILPHAKIMIHEPLIAGNTGGNATSIQRLAESIMETKKITVELLAADTGKSKEAIEQAITFDNYDNIFIERLWRSVKYEDVYLKDYQCPRDARLGLSEYLRYYNEKRPHQSLGYRTPADLYFGSGNF